MGECAKCNGSWCTNCLATGLYLDSTLSHGDLRAIFQMMVLYHEHHGIEFTPDRVKELRDEFRRLTQRCTS